MKDIEKGPASERIDRWLWQVRVFKTRSRASQAGESGKIIINDHTVKSSYRIKTGQVIRIMFKTYTRTVKITGFPNRRVGASLVDQYMLDLTPEEEFQKKRLIETEMFAHREPGKGRPTKRERRQLNKFQNKY